MRLNLSPFLTCYFYLFGFIFLISACQNSATSYSNELSNTGIAASDAQTVDHLLQLIDRRLNLAADVAKAKWNTGSPIDDPKREAQILEKVVAQASAMKIPTDQCRLAQIKTFFQYQFDAGKIVQRNLWANWRNNYSANYQFKDAPNLSRDVRPLLDKLTPELISAFCEVQPILSRRGVEKYLKLKSDAMLKHDATDSAWRLATKSIGKK